MYWYDYPELRDRAYLIAKLREGLSYRQIGDILGCSRDVIRGAVRKHKLSRPLILSPPKQT